MKNILVPSHHADLSESELPYAISVRVKSKAKVIFYDDLIQSNGAH